VNITITNHWLTRPVHVITVITCMGPAAAAAAAAAADDDDDDDRVWECQTANYDRDRYMLMKMTDCDELTPPTLTRQDSLVSSSPCQRDVWTWHKSVSLLRQRGSTVHSIQDTTCRLLTTDDWGGNIITGCATALHWWRHIYVTSGRRSVISRLLTSSIDTNDIIVTLMCLYWQDILSFLD